MSKHAKVPTSFVPTVWAIVCDMRRSVVKVRVARFPDGVMTRREKRFLARAAGYLDAAEEEIRKAQASLAERSELAGFDTPDYETARKNYYDL